MIDPVRTISAGKVNLGAFRTYPKGYKPPDEGPGEYQTIPLNKIEDFGVHCKSYYRLVANRMNQQALDLYILRLLSSCHPKKFLKFQPKSEVPFTLFCLKFYD